MGSVGPYDTPCPAGINSGLNPKLLRHRCMATSVQKGDLLAEILSLSNANFNGKNNCRGVFCMCFKCSIKAESRQ